MIELTIEKLIATYKKLNYPFFINGDFNLNCFGIKSNQSSVITDKYDDLVGIAYKFNDNMQLHTFPATVNCGKFYAQNPMQPQGFAEWVPGHYKGIYKAGLHNNKPALIQSAPIHIWRGRYINGKYIIDKSKKEIGMYKMSWHCYGTPGALVGMNSAGCIDNAFQIDFNWILAIAQTSLNIYGGALSFTMFDECDFE